jgi:ParB family chromosome partitioning protein
MPPTGKLDLAFPVANLRPAPYNPRAIGPDAIDALQESIRRVGFAKPIIVTTDGVIVAGHQRSKAAAAMGLATVPAWVLWSLSTADEVRFNQLHNGTDLDQCDKPVRVTAGPVGVFEEVPPAAIEGDAKDSSHGTVRMEVARLLQKYGNWGGCVAAPNGEVLTGQQYALACKILGMPARVYRVDWSQVPDARVAFGRTYGAFSYDHLPRDSYVQSFAQPFRLREGETGKVNGSSIHAKHFRPWLAAHPGARVLDFGCGQGDFAHALRKAGVAIWMFEPFYRIAGSLNASAVHRQVDKLTRALTEGGLFDAVICEAVLNSVDTPAAEEDVLRTVTALVRPGGQVFLSGRKREELDGRLKSTRLDELNRRVEFLDADGFTALYRSSGGAAGHWFYQRYHTRAEVERLVRRWLTAGPYKHTLTSSCWQASGPREVAVDHDLAIAALRREFNLPWPEGRSIDRADAIEAAYRAAIVRG